MATWASLLSEVRQVLAGSSREGVRDHAELDAELLLRFLAGAGSRLDFLARLAEPVRSEVHAQAVALAHERFRGRPLQHLTGEQPFLDHVYEVSPAALIPRPETEWIVSEVLQVLASDFRAGSFRGLEVGLGSGVISIELLSRFPSLRMLATELSPEAEQLAVRNASRILGGEGSGRLICLKPKHPLEVCEPFIAILAGKRAQFLISNPPYLRPGAPDEVEAAVAEFEPSSALFAPQDDPLHFYREIARHAPSLIEPAGWVFLEIAAERVEDTRALFSVGYEAVSVLEDLAGRPRMLRARTKATVSEGNYVDG